MRCAASAAGAVASEPPLKCVRRGHALAVAPSLRCVLTRRRRALYTHLQHAHARRTDFWKWRGYDIRYTHAGGDNQAGPAVLLIHGFGGNAGEALRRAQCVTHVP